MSYAVNLGDALSVITIQAVGSISADGNSTGVSLLGAVTANPSAATNYEGEILFILDAGNTAGSSPTLAIKLQTSDDDSSYSDVTGGAFTSLTDAASTQSISINRDHLKKYVRVNYDIGGSSSPAYNVSIQAVAAKKCPA